MHMVLLDGIYNTMNLLAEARNFGDLSTDDKSAGGYYIVKFLWTIKIRMKNIDAQIKNSVEKNVNKT